MKMTHYSIEPRDRIFLKCYGFLSFAKYMSKNIGKNISKNLSGKYSQRLLGHAKNLQQMQLKQVQKKFHKTAEATDDLIHNKIADEITKVSKSS